MKGLYARELLNKLLAEKELKILEIVSEEEDVETRVKELIELMKSV